MSDDELAAAMAVSDAQWQAWLASQTPEDHLRSWESEVRALAADEINGYDSYVGGVLGARDRIDAGVVEKCDDQQIDRLKRADVSFLALTEPDDYGYVARVTRQTYALALLRRVAKMGEARRHFEDDFGVPQRRVD